MIKALVIDDEPLAHEIVKTYLAEVQDVELVGHCYSAREAMDQLKKTTVDLLFLDINMPVISGLDMLSMLKSPPAVIITSAYEEYALEGFKLDVVDYLLKPYRFDRFEEALQKTRRRLESLKPAPTPQAHTDTLKGDNTSPEQAPSELAPSGLLIKVDKKHVNVAYSEIEFLEAYGNYVKVWRDGSCVLTPATLTSFEGRLPGTHFTRIHKSFIANKAFVDMIEGDTVVLKNGHRLPIGKRFRKAVLAW